MAFRKASEKTFVLIINPRTYPRGKTSPFSGQCISGEVEYSVTEKLFCLKIA